VVLSSSCFEVFLLLTRSLILAISDIYLIFLFILTLRIVDYVEINQLNALNYILLCFSFTMAPTCFGKTMRSSGSDCVPF
jgi:hypothetical protein